MGQPVGVWLSGLVIDRIRFAPVFVGAARGAVAGRRRVRADARTPPGIDLNAAP
jgi:hypothetical protein